MLHRSTNTILPAVEGKKKSYLLLTKSTSSEKLIYNFRKATDFNPIRNTRQERLGTAPPCRRRRRGSGAASTSGSSTGPGSCSTAATSTAGASSSATDVESPSTSGSTGFGSSSALIMPN